MLITDQVATAPCTDRVQARRRTFEAKLVCPKIFTIGGCVLPRASTRNAVVPIQSAIKINEL
jgi:hypothetical protein